MNREEIKKKVETIVIETLVLDGEVDESLNFIKDLNADSLDGVEMVMGIEDEFDISIPDDDADKFFTVRNVVDYLEKVLKDK